MGTPALAAGILVRPLSLYFAAQLAMGILLVSVLLIAVFLGLAWASDSREDKGELTT